MHELSIAGSVLESALRHAEGRRLTHVQLKIGHLRQVVPSAFRRPEWWTWGPWAGLDPQDEARGRAQSPNG